MEVSGLSVLKRPIFIPMPSCDRTFPNDDPVLVPFMPAIRVCRSHSSDPTVGPMPHSLQSGRGALSTRSIRWTA